MAEEVNAGAEKEKRRVYVNTYVSPWEHAMKDDEELKKTMRWKMPGPQVHKDLPKYKSFNRYFIIYKNNSTQTTYVLIVVIQLIHLHVVLAHKNGSALWRI